MWFIGSFALVGVMFLTSWVMGHALLAVLGIRLPAWKPEGAALGVVLGTAVLILTSGWLSGFGYAMRVNGMMLTAGLLLLSGGCLVWNWRRAARVERRPPERRRLMPLLALLAIAAFVSYLGLLSLLRENSYNPYNDTIASISLGEYLQDHSFRERVSLQVQNPVAAMTYVYQKAGYRMGVHYLLALMQSWIPFSRSVDVFPAVSVFGIILDLLTVYLCCRWLIRMPVFHSLCGCLFGFTNLSLALASAELGVMNQLYGVAFSFVGLALAGKLFSSATPRRWIIPLGVISGALVCAYSEMLPIYGLILLLAIALRSAVIRSWRWSWVHFSALCWAGGLAVIFSNIELVRAMKSIFSQLHASPGGHVPYSAFKFFLSWLGVYPLYQYQDFYTDIIGHGAVRWVYFAHAAVTLVLAACGLARLTARFRSLHHIDFICALLVYLGLAIYFSFFVKNPFIQGHMGQTWSVLKLTMYSFPLGICVLVFAFKRLPLAKPALLGIALISAIAYWPVHDELSHRLAIWPSALTGSATDPFGAYAQFADQVRRLSGGRAVRMAIPSKSNCLHFELAAYYLYPTPVASDEWKGSGCIYLGPHEGTAFLNAPPPFPVTLLSDQELGAEGMPLPAGFLFQQDSSPIRVNGTGGWKFPEISEGGWGRWVDGPKGEIALRIKRRSVVEIRGELFCPLPSFGATLRLDQKVLLENACGPAGFSQAGLDLTPGLYHLSFEPVPSESQDPLSQIFLRHFHVSAEPIMMSPTRSGGSEPADR